MKELRTVTLEQVLAMHPCIGATKIKAYARAAGLKTGTALDVLKMENVSANHRIWTILHPEFLSDAIMWEFACWCAEDALQYVKEKYGIEPDQGSINAIETRRKWLKGEATDEELKVACAAAWIAVNAAYAAYAEYDAVFYAARAAFYAARAAFYAANDARSAFYAARDAYAAAVAYPAKQVKKLIEMLTE